MRAAARRPASARRGRLALTVVALSRVTRRLRRPPSLGGHVRRPPAVFSPSSCQIRGAVGLRLSIASPGAPGRTRRRGTRESGDTCGDSARRARAGCRGSPTRAAKPTAPWIRHRDDARVGRRRVARGRRMAQNVRGVEALSTSRRAWFLGHCIVFRLFWLWADVWAFACVRQADRGRRWPTAARPQVSLSAGGSRQVSSFCEACSVQSFLFDFRL